MFNFKFLSKIPKLSFRKRFLVLAPVLLLTGVLILAPLQFAQAGLYESIVRPIIEALTSLVLAVALFPFAAIAVLGYFLSNVFLIISSGLLTWVFDLTSNLALTGRGGAGSAFVQEGWTIVRDFVGMAFIIIILIIAFGTILRLREYELGKILPKLILAAILLNFSQVIAGVILDVSQIIMNIFLQPVIGLGSIFQNIGMMGNSLWTTFTGLISIETLKNPSFAFQFVFGVLAFGVAGMIFNIFASFIISLLGLVFLFRIVFIWLLIILSPAAFVAWILPQTSGWWKKWWNEFIKWAIIGIPISFFLFLTFRLLPALFAVPQFEVNQITAGFNLENVPIIGPLFFEPLRIIIGTAMRFGVILILMMMGLVMGFASSGGTAGMVIGKAGQLAKKAPAWARKRPWVQQKERQLKGVGAKAAVGIQQGIKRRLGEGKIPILGKVGPFKGMRPFKRIPAITGFFAAPAARYLEKGAEKPLPNMGELEAKAKRQTRASNAKELIDREVTETNTPEQRMKFVLGHILANTLSQITEKDGRFYDERYSPEVTQWAKDKRLQDYAARNYAPEVSEALAASHPDKIIEAAESDPKKINEWLGVDGLKEAMEKLARVMDPEQGGVFSRFLENEKTRQLGVDALVKWQKASFFEKADERLSKKAFGFLKEGIQQKDWEGLIEENRNRAAHIATTRGLAQKYGLSRISSEEFAALEEKITTQKQISAYPQAQAITNQIDMLKGRLKALEETPPEELSREVIERQSKDVEGQIKRLEEQRESFVEDQLAKLATQTWGIVNRINSLTRQLKALDETVPGMEVPGQVIEEQRKLIETQIRELGDQRATLEQKSRLLEGRRRKVLKLETVQKRKKEKTQEEEEEEEEIA